jgi:ABC-type Zn uptake system ZnuABC Zn-binding protein ZnuA
MAESVRRVLFLTRAAGLAVAAGLTPACTPSSSGPAGNGNRALTSISTFDSFVREVAGPHYTVGTLVPAGASPEDYQPTPVDVARLREASVIFQNGVGLETWLARTVANASSPALKVVTLSDGLTPVNGNPHLWMDPVFARTYVRNVRDALVALDPSAAAEYERNAAAYDARLATLRETIAKRIDTIPPGRRVMITYHNSFVYYNARFGLRSLGVIERSPGQEPSPADLAALVRLARANNVRAIFDEPQFSPKLARTLAEESGISVVSDLYSDTLGPAVSTYEAMLQYDTETIVRALGGSA